MKKVTICGGLSVLALAAAAGIATAQTAPAPNAGVQGADHQGWGHRGGHSRDADNDGRISQAEFMGDRVTRLTALDTNRDGTVSVEERQASRAAHQAERMTARFDRLDANKDGSVTRTEFDAARAGRAERGQRGDHMRGGRGHGRGHGPMHAGRMGVHDGERGPVVIADVQSGMSERFTATDTNRDGFLSADEQTAARATMRRQWQERGAERRAQRQANPASPPAPASE